MHASTKTSFAWLCRTFARLAEDPSFHFSVVLNPGEAEIIHNPTILHSRGDVEDGEVRAAHDIVWLSGCPFSRLLWFSNYSGIGQHFGMHTTRLLGGLFPLLRDHLGTWM